MALRTIGILLVAGTMAGIVFPQRVAPFFGIVTLYVFLPALILEAAWNIDFSLMRRKWRAIAVLAVPGVGITAAVIAFVTHALAHLSWPAAWMLGAVLSATDPVAVIAIFRRITVPAELATIVESEALLNDAFAVAL